jgi:hypothetical protein
MRCHPTRKREELAWAAGFFDGEGSFSWAGRYAHISIAQTDRELLDRFRDALDVGHVHGPSLARDPLRPSRTRFTFNAYGSDAFRRVTKSLWPHLGTLKRAQAIAAMRRTAGVSSADALCMIAHADGRERTWREELSWAAGFFDGEGCFSYLRASKYPCVSITQKHPEVLKRIRRALRLGKVYGPYRHHPGATYTGADYYLYRATGQEFVQTIAAKLWFNLGSAKRTQASKVLAQWPRACKRGHPKIKSHKGCASCTRLYRAAVRHARL